jgi:hypothetical protein
MDWKTRGVAEKRAKRLLFKFLTREQKWTLRAGYFDVIGQDGKTYRIKVGSCQNVWLLEDGVETKNYCIVAKNEWIPVSDLMLAQKLFLQHNIQAFFATANVRELRGRGYGVGPVPPVTREDAMNIQGWVQARLAG